MPDAAATPKKRGPNTPEGKARSAMNALKHGLRARDFVLLPEEDPQEWTQHVLDLEEGYGPVDATERKLVDAIAVAMWKEIRADRFEAEVLTDIPPRSKDRSHGSDLQVPDHAAALTTAIRYQGSAGMGARRAVRAFLEHRKAKQTGLLLPAAACTREPEMTKNTNELSQPARPHPAAQPAARRPAATGRARPRRVAGRRAGGRGRSVRRIAAPRAAGDDRAPDPARDRDQGAAEKHRAADRRQRQRRLRGVVREAAEGAVRAGRPARKPQGRHRGGDQAQPALDARAVSLLLPPAGAGASVRPGLRQRRASPRPSRPRIAPPPGETIPSLRARLARLLDRSAARLPEELDLAEAVCAIKWPNWPDYRGPIDLGLLRRALDGTVIDGPTLNWLGSHELVPGVPGGGRQRRNLNPASGLSMPGQTAYLARRGTPEARPRAQARLPWHSSSPTCPTTTRRWRPTCRRRRCICTTTSTIRPTSPTSTT